MNPCKNHYNKARDVLLHYICTTLYSELWAILRFQTSLTCPFSRCPPLLILAIVKVWTCLGNHCNFSMVTFHEWTSVWTTWLYTALSRCWGKKQPNLMMRCKCEQRSKLVWSLYYTLAKLLSFLCHSNLTSLIKMSSSKAWKVRTTPSQCLEIIFQKAASEELVKSEE